MYLGWQEYYSIYFEVLMTDLFQLKGSFYEF